MKRFMGMAIGLLSIVVGGFTPAAQAKLMLKQETAEKRFDRLVVSYHRHLSRESPGRADCERFSSDRFSCRGRWKATAIKDGVRTRFVYDARGAAKKGLDQMIVWAQMRRWEIAAGQKKGPLRGAILEARYPTKWPTVEIG
ncbi:MAG TPA: hypothetical protein VMF31_00815 [Solirubrobacterales bacterium]|nr:hypothetical protein [Solirubrobacterales bacterium]